MNKRKSTEVLQKRDKFYINDTRTNLEETMKKFRVMSGGSEDNGKLVARDNLAH